MEATAMAPAYRPVRITPEEAKELVSHLFDDVRELLALAEKSLQDGDTDTAQSAANVAVSKLIQEILYVTEPQIFDADANYEVVCTKFLDRPDWDLGRAGWFVTVTHKWKQEPTRTKKRATAQAPRQKKPVLRLVK